MKSTLAYIFMFIVQLLSANIDICEDLILVYMCTITLLTAVTLGEDYYVRKLYHRRAKMIFDTAHNLYSRLRNS